MNHTRGACVCGLGIGRIVETRKSRINHAGKSPLRNVWRTELETLFASTACSLLDLLGRVGVYLDIKGAWFHILKVAKHHAKITPRK